MCGIAGCLSVGGAGDPAVVVGRMTDAMAHRGPDDGGVEIVTDGDLRVGLGARRLAIQDLSAAGHQPMHDPATGNWIVFNGEIYNFHELRAELQAAGLQCRSGSDTEVLLLGYRHWGLEPMLARLHGMFAFVIWDARSRGLNLVRDRLGVKPLYYFQCGDGIVFASEVRTLLASGLVPNRVCLEGVAGYLQLGAALGPDTLIEGVRLLPAGASAVLSDGELSIHEYWSLADCFRGRPYVQSHDAAVRDVRDLLRASVRRRLVSDVPVGVFLSGGLDSTVIVALAAQETTTDLRTVSVVFPEETQLSEEPYIREVVQRYNTAHTQIELSGSDLLAMLPEALAAMDQPTFDGINTYIVSGQARAAGLKVALSGIGGDELFGGYDIFRRVPRLKRAASWVPASVGRAVGQVVPLVRDDDRARKVVRWLGHQDLDDGAHALARELFGPADRAGLAPSAAARFRLNMPDLSGLDAFGAVSCFEISHYLGNVLLRDTDVMGMAQSLEVREPLLDHELLELVASIPGSIKAAGNSPKQLLADALGADIPMRITHRPKMGFALPYERWLHGPLRQTVESALLDPSFGGQVARVLSPGAVSDVWHRFLHGKAVWVRPWSLYALKCWGERHLS